MGHSAQYANRIGQTIAAAAVVSVTALAVSSGPASAQHRGALGASMIGVQNSLANPKVRNPPFFDRKHQGPLSAFPAVVADPYWGSYGPDISSAYPGACGASAFCENSKPRWDDNNHSVTLEQRSFVTEQPSAKIITVPAHEDSEHYRAWLQRCEPRLVFDDYGIQRYHYNGKRGCEFGQWSD